MKTAFIIVTVAGLEDHTRTLVTQIKSWRLKNVSTYVIRNERGKEGYAAGVNKGIREALKDHAEQFIVANPDISLKGIHPARFFEVSSEYDVWGYAMNQNGITYYGGHLDAMRLSGGLSESSAASKFSPVDFVSGSLCGFHKKVIDTIGLWDEGYGMYYEDVDFCHRARAAGFSVGIDTGVKYTHFETSQENAQKHEQLAVNRLRFFLKYADVRQTVFETARLPLTLYEYRSLIWRSIKSRPFLLNFLSLNTSSLFLKLLNFILFLVLVRYLSVPDYGAYNVLWALIGFVNPIADFGTTTFGVTQLATSRVSFNELFSFRIVSAAVVAMVAVIVALFGAISPAGLFLIVSVLLANAVSGSFLILMTNKSKTYLSSLVSALFNVILIAAAALTLVITRSLTTTIVVIGSGYLLSAVMYIYFIARHYKPLAFLTDWSEWKHIMRYSSLFLLLSFFAGVYFRIDVLLLGWLQGNDAVGIYSAGYKIFEAFLFVASSYTIAASPVIQRLLAADPGKSLARVKRDGRLLFWSGTGLAVFLALLAPALLPRALNGQYLDSIRVFQITIFALPLMLVSTVYMSVLFILKKSKLILSIYAVQAFIVLAANVLFIPRYSFYASAWITVGAEIINSIAVMILVRKVYADIT